MKKFQHLTVGGTFDHFHKGHRAILDRAFSLSATVWIGVTTEKYLSSLSSRIAKGTNYFEPYLVRRTSVEVYLSKNGFSGQAKVLSIDDKFGSTLKEEKLEAIVVSPETELVATEINLLRARKNWPALEVVVVPWILADNGQPINSVRIRRGEIDREGRVYELSKDWGTRFLPDELRPQLHRPFGKLLSHLSDLSYSQLITHNLQLLITVGDAVTKSLIENGITPDISIVDFKIRRKPVHKNIAEFGFRNIKVFESARNKPGTLSYGAYTKLLGLIKEEARPAVLRINGEEDLMTLPAIFLVPLDSLIVYGQPAIFPPLRLRGGQEGLEEVRSGIVVVRVTEEKKHTARDFLSRFIPT